MANEQEYPAGYYFDDKKDDATEVPTGVPAEVLVEAPTEAPTEAKVETTKAPEMSPSEVAKQRRESIGNFFKNTKENFKNKVRNVGGSIVKFIGKTKALGGAIVEGGKALGSEALNQAGILGRETLEGAKTLGNEALNFAVAPEVYIKKGAEDLAEWSRNKAEIISSFAKGKAEIMATIAILLGKKSIEKVNEVQTSITKRYEALKQHGIDAIESAAGKIRDVKERHRNAKNNRLIAFLKSVEEEHRAKADKVANTIQLLQGLKAN